MKEITRQIITIAVLLLALFGATYWAQTKINNHGISFVHAGLLERNTPGIPKSDTWFLHYEADSSGKGAYAELVFPENTQITYSNLQFAKVEGNLSKSIVSVTSVSTNDIAYPDATQVAYHKSDVLGYFGTMTLKGYVEIEKHVCGPNDGECSQTVEYANFVFNKADNPEALDDLFHFSGGPFLDSGKIGLGCYEKNKNQISYQNNSDTDVVHGVIEDGDLSALLASSENKKVNMKMTQMVILTGKGAPDCYSAFRNFDVL